MVNETGPNGPEGGKGGDRMKVIKKAIAEILDREAVKSLRNEMAKFLRKRIADNDEMMRKIGIWNLRIKLWGVYKNGSFGLTDDEADMLIEEAATRFVKKREEMSDKERKNYVESATAVHREETNKKFNTPWEERILKKDGLDIDTINRRNRGDAGYEPPLKDPEDR